jgi:hypothetical protein
VRASVLYLRAGLSGVQPSFKDEKNGPQEIYRYTKKHLTYRLKVLFIRGILVMIAFLLGTYKNLCPAFSDYLDMICRKIKLKKTPLYRDGLYFYVFSQPPC